jgi:toxin FitB
VVTIAELSFGVERLARREHRTQLENWVQSVIEGFGSRVLPIELEVAETWGNVMAMSAAAGRSMAPMDCFLAATALTGDLTLVTRNTADFDHYGGAVISP